MGHTEMLLAVAGLDADALEKRTRMLASGDWSSLPPHERAAYFYAKKLAKTPAEIDDSDRRALFEHFGPERAIDVMWQSSWCNYMTRVADAFQLPLERDNVFAPPKPTATSGESKTH
jgi:alkylhydroperoxidase family enzyme